MSTTRVTDDRVWVMNQAEDAALLALLYGLESYVKLDMMAPNHAAALRQMREELFS